MMGRHIAYMFLSINISFFILLIAIAVFANLEESTNHVLWISLGISLFNIAVASVIVSYLKTNDISFG